MFPAITRRRFGATLTAAALAAAQRPASGFPSLGAGSDSKDYWQQVRGAFPFQERRVPMNAANLCPSPFVVSDRVSQLTRDIDVDCSFNNRAKFKQLLEISRRRVAEGLGVSTDEIALVRNTSEANNVINGGLDLEPGDEIVLWDQNHPTNNVAWEVRAARFHLSLRRLSTPNQPRDGRRLVELFAAALGPKTRVLALTHVSNVTGIKLPIREICELAEARDIHVHVDGAQSWGILDLNLRDLGCSSFAASAHKWFAGPKEAGILYVRKDRIPNIWPSVVAPGWGDDADPDPVGARKFESLGQRDDACLAAIATAADFRDAIGPRRIEARVFQLATRIKTGLKKMGAQLVTPSDSDLSAGVCIVEVPRQNRDTVFNRLYQEYGIAAAPTGGLRLSPHLYNTGEHIDRALAGVHALRDLMGLA